MTDDQVRLTNLMGPCPDCGNGRMSVVADDEGSLNLLCRSCGSCWHAELEWSRRVNPVLCPGCPSRGICAAAARSFGTAVPQLT